MCVIRQLMYKHSIIDCYPRLLDDETSSSFPGASESSISSSEESQRSFLRPTASFASESQKMSQDIMIFKKIAELMPPKSLLHLLHGAETTSRSTEPPEEDDSISEVIEDVDYVQTRSVRFQTDMTGQIKCKVFEVPCLSDPEIWWQATECSRIREGCKSLSEHYLIYQTDYVKAVERLMDVGCESTKKIKPWTVLQGIAFAVVWKVTLSVTAERLAGITEGCASSTSTSQVEHGSKHR